MKGIMMKCKDCKNNNNCEPKAKFQWVMSAIVSGCDKGIKKC